jgi:mRNA interferase ChpB
MGCGLGTDGSVHAHQLKSLDWAARQASFIEKVPATVLQEVLECLIADFEDE